MPYVVAELREGETGGFAPRGAAAELWRSKAPEIMLSGPAETGKTWTCCHKLNALMWKYPGAQAAVIRKTQASMVSSVLQTFDRVIGENSGVVAYGGEKPEWYQYPNGSRVWVGGMDNPNKVLSAERDFVYVCQSEELTVDDWETLRTRNTGRGGVAPYAQQFADCNPGAPTHWIIERKNKGTLKFLESRHEDNPTLYDDDGNITEQGIRSLQVLDALTGARYYRLRKGLWVGAEGIIYENWDPAIHVKPPRTIPQQWPRVWAVDFGYTNPFVWQSWAIDPDDRMWLVKEIYRTKLLVEDAAKRILEVSKDDPRPTAIICDHDAEDRATLERHLQMAVKGGYKGVKPGLQAVEARIRKAGDDQPRIFILEDALVHEPDPDLITAKKPTCTAQEIAGYIWNTRGGQAKGEEPLKENDHGMDTMRYGVAYVDKVGPAAKIVTFE
jgi:phage terminase large subunit